MSSRRKITVTFEVDDDALEGLASYLEGVKLDGVLQTALTVEPLEVNSLGSSVQAFGDALKRVDGEDPPQKVRYLSISNAPGFRAFALHVLAQGTNDANTTFLFSSEDSDQLAQDLFYLHRFVWRIGHRPIDAHPQERRPDWLGQPDDHQT